MGLNRSENDSSLASGDDLKHSFKVPSPKEAGISMESYRRLVSNPQRNVDAFMDIVEIIDTSLQQQEDLESLPDWISRADIEGLVNNAFDFFTGLTTDENTQGSLAMVSYFFDHSLAQIDKDVCAVKEINDSLNKTRKEVRSLHNADEPESLEELEIKHSSIIAYHEALQGAYGRMEEEQDNLILALRASAFITSQLL